MTQVVGVASAVSQMPTNVAAGLMGLGLGDPQQNAAKLAASRPAARPPTVPPTASIAPVPQSVSCGWRRALPAWTSGGLPERLEEQTCRRGSDVAFYLRVDAARGGPLMAQLAAYGLAMTARESASRSQPPADQWMRRVTRALAAARPGSPDAASGHSTTSTPSWRRWARMPPARRSPTRSAAAADALAMEAQVDHARIARSWPRSCRDPRIGRSTSCSHGDPGTMTSGLRRHGAQRHELRGRRMVASCMSG